MFKNNFTYLVVIPDLTGNIPEHQKIKKEVTIQASEIFNYINK